MVTISYEELKGRFKAILLAKSFTPDKSELLSRVFADNTLDGVNSHGINRFPGFVHSVERGEVNKDAVPEKVDGKGMVEHWDGHYGIGVYNAEKAMERAVALAKQGGIGCVALKNTNHWMRAGTYGWQAANAGCIGICFTNAIATMPPYGGIEPRLGNNPLVIAVPRKEGNLVLDMAVSQFSFGKMYNYELEGKQLPFPGGYDQDGKLTADPHAIRKTMNALPIGKWKGSGLALMLDILLTALTGGNATGKVTASGTDTGISQCFIAIHQEQYYPGLIEEILNYTKSSKLETSDGQILYPGEGTLRKRLEHLKNGIPISEKPWERLLAMEAGL